MSRLKTFRRSFKSTVARYPWTRRLYVGASSAAQTAKLHFAHLADRLFPNLVGPRIRLTHHYFSAGQLDKAVAVADDLLARKPHRYDTFNWLAHLYNAQGRSQEASRLYALVERRSDETARELQLDRLRLRFFLPEDFALIGHLAVLEKYLKAEILEMIPRCTNIILGAPEQFSNPAYVGYLGKYLSFITNPGTISLLAPLSDPLRGRLNTSRAFCRDIELRWKEEGRGPLLKLTAEHRERGYRLLRELGVPEGAWFVGLHVREGKERTRALRDADIGTYQLAVEEIARRGGWVLRMGDQTMRALPSWPNTVDYVHSGKRVDWMDVFLWAEGRFFIGSGSGPQLIPPTFGKAVAIANWGPLATMVCGKDDILLPKHYWHECERRYLTLAERMSQRRGIRDLESAEALAAMGIRVLDNSPEELRDLVIEMLDRLEGRHTETEHERALQARFAQMALACDLCPVRIACAFTSRHADLL